MFQLLLRRIKKKNTVTCGLILFWLESVACEIYFGGGGQQLIFMT